MTKEPKQAKLWNPGLDLPEENQKEVKSTQPPPFLLNPLIMFSIMQQQQNAIRNQVPPFIQLLNANQTLNTGIHPPTQKSNKQSRKPVNKQPIQKAAITQQTTTNPIVDSVLGNSSSPINYNCCAICGISFRLTTDLVAHMRTSHRQSRYKRKLNSENEEESN